MRIVESLPYYGTKFYMCGSPGNIFVMLIVFPITLITGATALVLESWGDKRKQSEKRYEIQCAQAILIVKASS